VSAELSRSVAESQPPDDGVRVGIVASVSPLVITLQGVPLTLAGQLGVSVSVGDAVALLRQDQSWLVLGAILNREEASDGNFADQTLSNITDSIASFTLTPIAGWPTMTFRRSRPNSRLDMQLTVGARPTGAVPNTALYALRITNPATGGTWTPTIIPAVTYSTASAHASITVRRLGLPAAELGAGDLEAEILWRRSTGTGTINIGSGLDTVGLTIKEL
jgi:hypothetical protein